MNPSTPKPPSRSSEPQYVGFECHVCQTRMYARPEQVGRTVKCPDCGAKTQVPPPVAVKAKPLPAALEGEQYELWDVDAAPLPSELRAAQPTYIAIECRLCQTLFYATLDQVGQEQACPDCGTRHVVPRPPSPAAPKHRLVSGAKGYALDPAAAPVERPPVTVPPRRPMLYEEEAEREREGAARDARRGKRRFDGRGRPIMPHWPLLTGVVSFMFSPGTPVRWFALSAAAAIAGGMAMTGAGAIGMGGGFVSAGMNAIGGVCLFVAGCILGTLWLAALASIVVAIVVESSEGNSQVYNWPPANAIEWLPELMQVVVAGFVSAFPGWLVVQFVPGDATFGALVVAGSALITLPIVLLSQLDVDSPLAVLSGHVLMSLVRCPFSWLLFYLELAAVVAGCVAATYYGIRLGESMLALLIPLYVAATLLAARLLGRLAWRLAEAMPATETGQDDRAN